MRLTKHCIALLVFLLIVNTALTQVGCSVNGVLGQTPASAFPVCATSEFIQDSVPICENFPIPAPGCRLIGIGDYKDKNPFWYTFTCYGSGDLGFIINPKNPEDNYDWQFYDITGHGASEIYSDGALVRGANWSGSPGLTGASSSGQNVMECASGPEDHEPTFSKMPNLIEGHTYLLLISHHDDGTQSGFKLSFKGGTAVITNPATPAFFSANANCDGTQIRLKLTKKMTCKSIAPDGSDFEIQGLSGAINSAVGVGCSGAFSTDSVIVNLSSALSPGSFSLVAKSGGDGNVLLDNCGNELAVGKSIAFTALSRLPVALDSITPLTCAPVLLQLAFQKNISCSSIASNGSDFKITGPYPVTIVTAKGNCSNGLSNTIELQLAQPMVHEGRYTLTLLSGTDGNSITDECTLETPAGTTLDFDIKDTVNAAFTYQLKQGCRSDTVIYFSNLENGKKNWNWQFDSTKISGEQNPVRVYNTFGDKTTQLITGNGFCSDTAVVNFYLDHDSLRADFTMPAEYCPNELAYFSDSSTGSLSGWNWHFGNGFTSTLQIPPPQFYSPTNADRLFPVQLIVQNNKNCYDTTIKYLKVLNNCYIAVPTAFTPNGDGRNDYLFPLNAYRTANLEFKIFNKFGQQLFTTKDRTNKWDGTCNGSSQPPGVYVWFLQYTNTDTGKTVFEKGTTVLIR